MHFVERDWLSANHILFLEGDGATIVDTGYVSHAAHTLQLLEHLIGKRSLTRILNTHLHSDHCGGNAALQTRWPQVQTWIAPGPWPHVQNWDPEALSYIPTGQDCPRFRADHVLCPGSSIRLGAHDWHIHAAPGHDPHAIVLFEPQRRLLISADALWAHGFGVVFPEIEGFDAFAEVAATLDLIEQLQPRWVLPGHGPAFGDVQRALATARQRLHQFAQAPIQHAEYAAKVLLKYKLLEWQHRPVTQVQAWCAQTPYMAMLHSRYFHTHTMHQWLDQLMDALVSRGAATREVHAGIPMLSNR